MTRIVTHCVFLLIPLACAGCWAGDEPETEPPSVSFGAEPADVDWLSRRAGPSPLDTGTLESSLWGRYAVAPDRALVRARVHVEAPYRRGALESMHGASEAIVASLNQVDRCEGTVIDLSAPRPVSDERHAADATIRLVVDLSELGTLVERQTAIEDCLARFNAASAPGARITVSDPLPTVADPGSHRAALLEHALEGVREVTHLAEHREELDADAVRCTSVGRITVVERSLAEIVLAVDLSCQPELPPAPREPASAEVELY